MSLSRSEGRVLDEIARRVTADDPNFARRLSAFGGYEGSALGLPGRWTLLPVVLVGLLLVAGFMVVSVMTSRDGAAADAGARTPPGRICDTGSGRLPVSGCHD